MKQNLISETFNINKENNIYQLNIETNEKKIFFTLNLLSNSKDYYYITEINSIELIEKLGLNSQKFTETKKILNIFNQLCRNNKISLEQKNDDIINLIIYYTILYEENKLEINLNKVKITIEDKLNILYNQINYLTNKLKFKKEIQNNTDEINELNISINKKEKKLRKMIEEKDNIIKEISNKLLNQEKIIKELNNSNYIKMFFKKIDEIENNIKYNFDKYKQEINNIKNILINDINNQLNLQNNIIKEFTNKYKNISFNEENISIENNLSMNKEEIKKKKNKICKNEQSSSISLRINSENSTKKSIKEILKEMNQKINKTNIQDVEEGKKEINDENNYDESVNINFNIPDKIISEKILTESDFEIQENTNNYINYEDKINYKFKKNPKNLQFKLNITYTNTNWGANDIFEVFLCYKDNMEYLISPNYINNNLEIYSLLKLKIITSIEGHKNRITVIRYFIDITNNQEYLLSADYNKVLIVWDITNNYKIKYIINTQYGTTLYSSLIFFAYNINSNYLIASTWNTSDEPVYSATKIYSLETGEYIKYINNTKNEKIYYLLPWYNKQNNKYYIVQFAYKKIMINNLIEDELYSELVDIKEYYHYSGFIYTRNNIDYLCSSASNGYIKIWNLYDKKLFKFINTNNCCLFHIIKWNNYYIIVADYNNKSFKIIDLYSGEIIKDFNGYHSGAVKCIKKFFHPIYGECLLSSGEDKTIKLWITNVV